MMVDSLEGISRVGQKENVKGPEGRSQTKVIAEPERHVRSLCPVFFFWRSHIGRVSSVSLFYLSAGNTSST